jgi:hypothetical protein
MTEAGIDSWKLYAFDIDTRALRSVPLAQRYLDLAGVRPSGHLVALYGHNIPEFVIDVLDLNPATGATSELGRIDRLGGWTGTLAFDAGSESVYLLADDTGVGQSLYTFQLSRGAATSVPFSPGPINWAFAKY